MLLLALGVRVAIMMVTAYHHADEVWQYIEPAYGVVTGEDWIRTWDIRSGIRSWLIPILLVAPVWLGHVLAPEALLHIHLARLVMVIASLGTVWAAWSLGQRVSRRHAVVAAFVAAIWVDFAYFAPRTSSDALALSLLLPAIALLYRFRERFDPWQGVLAGLLLGLGFVVRFPLGPAIGILMLWAGRTEIRRGWLPLAIGFTLGIACDIAANLVMGQVPLQWIVRNLFANVVQQRSHAFGVEVPQWYLMVLGWEWQYIAAVLLPAIVIGARRFPVLLVTALVVIATHSLIAHKEYRFILLGVCLLVLLASVGSVDLADGFARKCRRNHVGRPTLVALSLLWLAATGVVGATEPFKINWGIGKTPIRALATARKQPGFCGLATYRIRDTPFVSRAYLGSDVPVLLIDGAGAQADVFAAQTAFNVVIAPAEYMRELPSTYRFKGCMSPTKPLFEQQYCVLARPRPCSGNAGVYEYNSVLERMDR